MMNALALRIVDLVSDDNNRKYEPAGRIAAAIIELCRAQGDCQQSDLRAKGFGVNELEAHWHLAQSLAAVELKLMEGENHA